VVSKLKRPKVCVRAMVTESQRDFLIEMAEKREMHLSELLRNILSEVIQLEKEEQDVNGSEKR
jgi:hypothetical protein